MIRVLHIVGKMHRAGQESFIMNLYRAINRDEVQFDFAVCTREEQAYDQEIRELGGNVYYTTPMSEGIFKRMHDIRRLIKKNNYDIVHRHTSNAYVFLDLLAAKAAGVKRRYLHSHNNFQEHTVLNRICRLPANMLSTQRFACSDSAGLWLFGDKMSYIVIPNAIDSRKYSFCQQIRDSLRNELGLSDRNFVIGHVGRFNFQKNHKKIINVFEEIHRRKPNAVLLLVGDGELKDDICDCIKGKGLEKFVIMTGSRDDIPELLMAMDCFIFPSIFEGLGIAGIEAQASGLQCFMGNKIPKETLIVKELVHEIPNDASDSVWADNILQCDTSERKVYDKLIRSSGYDISELAVKFETEYYK